MKYIKYIVVAVSLVGNILLGYATPVYAQSLGTGTVCSGNNANSVVCQNSTGSEAKVNKLVKDIINILLFITTIISVIMIIIGGIRYATSNGDAGTVAGAKNTILYSVIGLAVAIFAFAIVNFVANRVIGSKSGAGQGQSASSNTGSDGADSNGIVP